MTRCYLACLDFWQNVLLWGWQNWYLPSYMEEFFSLRRRYLCRHDSTRSLEHYENASSGSVDPWIPILDWNKRGTLSAVNRVGRNSNTVVFLASFESLSYWIILYPPDTLKATQKCRSWSIGILFDRFVSTILYLFLPIRRNIRQAVRTRNRKCEGCQLWALKREKNNAGRTSSWSWRMTWVTRISAASVVKSQPRTSTG